MNTKKIALALASIVSLGTGSISHAAEIVQSELLPAGYGESTVVNDKTTWEFDTAGCAWHAATLHDIITAYGGKLGNDLDQLPSGYVKRIVPGVDDAEPTVVFGEDGIAWTPATLNKVLNAYGLYYDATVGSIAGYASVIAGQDDNPEASILSFSSGGKMWSPKQMNHVFQAYVKKS